MAIAIRRQCCDRQGMLPASTGMQQASLRRLPRQMRVAAASALALSFALAATPAWAQDGAPVGMGTTEQPEGQPPPLSTPLPPIDPSTLPPAPSSDRQINFEASEVAYDQNVVVPMFGLNFIHGISPKLQPNASR